MKHAARHGTARSTHLAARSSICHLHAIQPAATTMAVVSWIWIGSGGVGRVARGPKQAGFEGRNLDAGGGGRCMGGLKWPRRTHDGW
jgi:hypothetical protein